jgi:ATP-dependent RNA circularization protein (DNA/RNA ligase family)
MPVSHYQTRDQKRIRALENQVNRLFGKIAIQERINEQVTRILSVLEKRTREGVISQREAREKKHG